jgi:hypothetical protein
MVAAADHVRPAALAVAAVHQVLVHQVVVQARQAADVQRFVRQGMCHILHGLV